MQTDTYRITANSPRRKPLSFLVPHAVDFSEITHVSSYGANRGKNAEGAL